MNTSHNKDLIVDDGLKATILNACKLPFKFPSCNTISHEDRDPENAVKEIKPNNSSPGDLQGKGDTMNKKKIGIFTVSENICTSAGQSNGLPNVPE